MKSRESDQLILMSSHNVKLLVSRLYALSQLIANIRLKIIEITTLFYNIIERLHNI